MRAYSQVPVFLINLDQCTERLRRVDAALKNFGIQYTRIPAIDGEVELPNLLPKVDQGAYRRNMGQTLLPGKVGCYFSHLKAWQYLVNSNHNIALILEEDVALHSDFCEALNYAVRAKTHWDILRLSRVRAKLPICQGQVGPYSLNAYVGPCTGNAAYLINRETALLLLQKMVPQRRAADHEINRFFSHGFRLRGLEPFPSHSEDFGDSQITGHNYSKVKKFAKLYRLPYYAQKVANYFRRLAWMFAQGELFSRGRILALEDPSNEISTHFLTYVKQH